jgi:predicted DCC family thiol-disulfide oxidoreductase YuxK
VGHRLGRDGSRLTILFDRDCGICGLTARTLRRWDRNRRFRLLPLQDVPGSGDPGLVAVAERYALRDELHAVDEAGSVAAGGDAALAILDALPGGWLLRPWAALAPVRTAVRLAYDSIARNRRQIGVWLGLELVCELPDRPVATTPRSPAARDRPGSATSGRAGRPPGSSVGHSRDSRQPNPAH